MMIIKRLKVLLLIVACIPTTVFSEEMQPNNIRDTRISIVLSSEERAFVLLEMRQFLDSTSQIMDAIVSHNIESAVKAAKASGRTAQQGTPHTLPNKLPKAFKKLGFDTHSRFDQLALDAEQLGDEEQTLLQLNELLKNCVACHSAYKIEAP